MVSECIESFTMDLPKKWNLIFRKLGAGRDGTQSCVYILYQGILLAHVDGYMKQYVKTNHCRIKKGVAQAL